MRHFRVSGCRFPSIIAFSIALAATSILYAQPAAAPQPTRPDWSRIVPNDVRFYVELNDLEAIRSRFTKLGIWKTVRDITQDSPSATTQPLYHRTERLLGMNADEAISAVLGRRSALIASRSARWQQGVIIAELERASDVRGLLRRWAARRSADEGPVRRYVLRGGLLLAVLDRLIVLGPADDPEGLWARTVLLLSGKDWHNHLQGKSRFASMRMRLNGQHDGLMFVTWPEGDTYSLAGCERLIVGFSITDEELRCELHGDGAFAASGAAPLDVEVIRALPADTLFVWSGSIESGTLDDPPPGSVLDDDRSLPGMFVGMLSAMNSQAGGLLAEFGPRVTVVVGRDPTTGRDALRLPVVGIVCEARHPEKHIRLLDVAVHFFASVMDTMATGRRGPMRPITVKTRRVDGVELHYVDIGTTLAKRPGLEWLEHVQVCWAALDGRLLLSTSTDHVKRIILARRGRGERLADVRRVNDSLPTQSQAEQVSEWVLVRGRETSDLIRNLLRYVRRHHPDLLRDHWWRQWVVSRLHEQTRLGVALKNDPNTAGRATIIEIERSSPAAGLLQVGDVIVGVAGRPLSRKEAAREVAKHYYNRGTSSQFRVAVLRDGKRLDLAIPVIAAPDVNLQDFRPMRTLRRLMVLLRPVRSAMISSYGTTTGRLDLDIRVRWDVGGKKRP